MRKGGNSGGGLSERCRCLNGYTVTNPSTLVPTPLLKKIRLWLGEEEGSNSYSYYLLIATSSVEGWYCFTVRLGSTVMTVVTRSLGGGRRRQRSEKQDSVGV